MVKRKARMATRLPAIKKGTMGWLCMGLCYNMLACKGTPSTKN